MKYINEEGRCPKCKGMNLVYGTLEIESGMCYYPYTCKDCGQLGEEWYSMEFAGHNVLDGEEWVEL